MTTFTKLKLSNGNEVFVNHDHVRYVTKDGCNEGMSEVAMHGITLHVEGEPEDIVMRMIRNSKTDTIIRWRR